MRYSLFAGGKRLRPALTLAAADTVATGPAAEVHPIVLPAACAVELIHTYSLIHDDLPSMDDDTLRRGRPTAHVVFGEGLAVLAGDALLTEAFRILARWPEATTGPLAARKLRVLERVATGAGADGMVGGQVIDLEAAGKVWSEGTPVPPAALDAQTLRGMHERKTAALIRAAATAGAIMAGASESETEAVDAYGRQLGLAFQIVDDILDVEGEAASLGKTVGKDAAAGKPTYPSMYGLDASRRMADDAMTAARDALAGAGLEGPLGDIATWVVSRRH